MLPTAAVVFEKLPRALRRHRLMKAWMSLTGECTLQLVRIRDDAYGYADLSDGFLRLIVIEGEFERDFFRIADSLLQSGGVFFDVGANHGLLSLGLARKFSDRVSFHLFEPNLDLQKSIEKSLMLYPPMRIRINPEAVSDRDSEVQIHFQEGHLGMSYVVNEGGVPVRSIKLDTYLSDQRLERVDFLKMDIEGYELAALRGAIHALENRKFGAIYFEYCENWLSRHHPPTDLLKYLTSVGYEVCFCRRFDLDHRGGATHTIRADLPGHGIPLLPVTGHCLPEMTDLLAIPDENLVRIGV